MDISKHARKRCLQRGIPERYLDLIVLYGVPQNRPGGVVEYRIDNKTKSNIQTLLKNMSKQIERLGNKAVIVDGENIITAYNKKQ